jgi:hypothetical protein
MANLNEMLVAFSYRKQTNLTTLGTQTYWRLPNLNRQPWALRPVAETDANEVGQGDEFAHRLFKSHIDNGIHQLQYYGSVEMMTFALAFGLGKVALTGSSPNYTYTITPLVPSTDGLELPFFSYVQQIRPGGSQILDQLFKGCCVEGFKIGANKGPGRQSVTCMIDVTSPGLITDPSTVTVPALATFHDLNASTLTVLTINGVDYLANKGLESFEFGWANNIRPGFFPGSGTSGGFQTEGRKEVGDRSVLWTMTARLVTGSPEQAALLALTTGSAEVKFTSDSNNSVDVTWPLMSYTSAVIQDSGGIATVQVTGMPLVDPTLGLMNAVCKVSGNGNICQ